MRQIGEPEIYRCVIVMSKKRKGGHSNFRNQWDGNCNIGYESLSVNTNTFYNKDEDKDELEIMQVSFYFY